MKTKEIVAVIVGLLGIANLAGIVPAIRAGAPALEIALILIFGACAVIVAAGILKKKRGCRPYGYAAILSAAAYFAVSVWYFATQKEGVERLVLLSASIVGALLVSAFWCFVWYRQQKYFLPDEEKKTAANPEGCVRPERSGAVNTTGVEQAPASPAASQGRPGLSGGPEMKPRPTKD